MNVIMGYLDYLTSPVARQGTVFSSNIVRPVGYRNAESTVIFSQTEDETEKKEVQLNVAGNPIVIQANSFDEADTQVRLAIQDKREALEESPEKLAKDPWALWELDQAESASRYAINLERNQNLETAFAPVLNPGVNIKA